MAILRSHGILIVDAIPTHTPTGTEAILALDSLTGILYRWDGDSWEPYSSALGSPIDAADIADGSVTNTEFQYINSLTSNAQTQLDGKSAIGHNHAATDIGDGSVTDTEFGYINTLSSNAQTQLDAKAPLVHTHVAADVTDFQTASRTAVVTNGINDGVTDKSPSEDAVFDALALKAASAHTHVAADVTDFQTASRTAVVTNGINDGVTDKSPSEDAVFDALALKSATGHTHLAADVTDLPAVAGGTYNAATANLSGLASAVVPDLHYIRVGSRVTIFGYIDLLASTAGADGSCTLDLPVGVIGVAGVFQNLESAAGFGISTNGAEREIISIEPSLSVANSVLVKWANPSTDIATVTFHINFNYYTE